MESVSNTKKNKADRESGHKQKIIVALDTSNLEVAGRLLRQLQGLVSFYKVGSELFTAHGWAAVELVRKYGGKVFLDLKLHDIPNTVSRTAAVICEHDIEMMTVHASGGAEMMKKARAVVDERAATGKNKPLIVGVTVLTSHSEKDLQKELGVSRPLQEQVKHLARLAYESGLDGIVSSPQETAMLRAELPGGFLMIAPGVRPAGSAKSDQKRTFTPLEAIRAGADFLVIGRPITGASNPKKQTEAILASLEPKEA